MDVADLTLDELRLALAPGIAEAAIFDGWSDAALDMAADQLGADRDVARLAFKDDGAMGMICAWIETIDRQMTLDLPPEKLVGMKIRERIRSLVQYRLDAVAGQEEALRRALAIMAMPRNASAGASSRSAIWFSARSGSPPASARAAAEISESIRRSPRLSACGDCTAAARYFITAKSLIVLYPHAGIAR